MTSVAARFPWKPLAIAALLLAGLAWLALNSRGPNPMERAFVLRTVGQIDETDAILNQDVLKARYGHLRHYDPLNASMAQMVSLVESFQNGGNALQDPDQRGMVTPLRRLQELLKQKEAVLERFKSENALFANSVMFFPVATEQLADLITSTESPHPHVRSPLVFSTHRLLRAVLIYQRSSDVGLLAEIGRHRQALESVRQRGAEPYTAHIETVLRHADVIVELKPLLDSTVNELLGFKVGEVTQALFEPYEREYLTAVRGAETYRWALAAYTLALLMYVAYLFLRLRSGARQLARTNTELSSEIAVRRYTEAALFAEKERAEVTLHSIGDAVITIDAKQRVTYLNPVAEGLTGWGDAEAREQPLEEVFKVVHELTREPALESIRQSLHEGRVVELAERSVLLTRDGRQIPIEDSAAPIRNRDDQVIGVVIVFHDVTRERELHERLTWEASHDHLTGLVNRAEFELSLERAVHSATTQGRVHALLYLDLDQFKIVNDTCGHVAGDELLRQLAGVLRSKVREYDVVARLGGDEFGVLLTGCQLPKARQIADQLRMAVRDFHFVWESHGFEIGVSIGLVPITVLSGSQAEIMSAADVACYAAKDLGRNRVHVHEEGDLSLARRHGELRWVARLNSALEENRFQLYYQPIVPVRSAAGGREQYEILLRLVGESGELILPEAFLPAAERYDLMPKIDRWVVRAVCAAVGRRLPDTPAQYSINLSGITLGDDQFLDFIQEQFRRSGVSPNRICFEITETAAIANLTRAINFIRVLRELGCRFALDDFGSGLSSFSYLKNLPVDYLKIDGGFVRDMLDDPIDDAMVQAINQIGHVMRIETIAESVESEAILQRLKEIGVDYAQGYAISPPQPFPGEKL